MRKTPKQQPPESLYNTGRRVKHRYLAFAAIVTTAVLASPVALAADDPLTTINNLSNFIFSAIKAVGLILLGFGIVQIGLSLKGHDPSQRAQGFLSLFGGVLIFFSKEILDLITGG